MPPEDKDAALFPVRFQGRWAMIHRPIISTVTMGGHAPGGADPGSVWRIVFEGAGFTFSVDGEELGRFDDSDYRSGYVGFWCYQNTGQEVYIDDVSVEYRGGVRDGADGNHGTVGSGVTAADGFVGEGAAAFDGSEAAFVDVGPGNDDNFATQTGITIELLLKVGWSGRSDDPDVLFEKADGEERILFAFQNDGVTGNRDIPITPSAQPVLAFGLNVGGMYRELDMPLDGADGRPSLADLKDGEPHHLAAVYDAAAGRKAIAVDGVIRFSFTVEPAGALIANGGNGPATIGNNAERAAAFTGVIDEVAFWNRALSEAEIERHAANGKAGLNYFVPTETEQEETGPKIVFNETFLSAGDPSWIEVANVGNKATRLEGVILAGSEAPEAQYVFPEKTLPPGEYFVVTEEEAGFTFASGDKLFLFSPGRSEVLGGIVLEECDRSRG